MAGNHARLSASAAERWMNCPGSQQLIEKLGLSSKASIQAAEGTFAHHIAAVCLSELAATPGSWLANKTLIDGHEVTCDEEMVDGINFYMDGIAADRQNGDRQWVEMPLLNALAKLHPDLGGTADFIRWRPSTRNLRVRDFKYGAGLLVEAEDNRQLRIYALGALLATGVPAQTVTVTIDQPRIGEGEERSRDWTFPSIDLLDFAADVIDAAQAANKPDAPFAAGPWCKKSFCPAAAACPALEKMSHSLMSSNDFAVDLPYDMDRLTQGLAMIPALKAKIKAMEEFAYHEANRGVQIPGYKLVEKQARRQWVAGEEDVVAVAEEHGVDPYERKLVTPAKLEAAVAEKAPRGKKKEIKASLAHLSRAVSSGTVLVPESDDRAPVRQLEDKSDFAAIDGTADTSNAQTPVINLF